MFIKKLKIPKSVELNFKDNYLNFNRSLNKNEKLFIPEKIIIKITDNNTTISLNSKFKKILGLYNFIISNKLNYGIKRFKIKLVLNGIGYKVNLENKNILNLKLGYSHDINLKIPENIKIRVLKFKEIILYCDNLNNITQFAHNLRNLRKIDPYKGKGILFKNEVIIKKEGKKK